MAVVLGTNSGFVTTAPTADPEGNTVWTFDTGVRAQKDVAPTGAIRVTEIGWYCDNATEAANFELAIYQHNTGDDEPEAIHGTPSRTNAKGTTAGWKRATGLNISITAGTTYWVIGQLDNTATATQLHYTLSSDRVSYRNNLFTLPDPYGTSVGFLARAIAFYAIVEIEAVGTNIQLNIGDAWKTVDGVKINIGDVWKDVAGMQVNIGDSWKTIF